MVFWCVTAYGLVLISTQNFSLVGGAVADPEATYNLCLILKIML
jgi:hypothetical protein